MRTNPYKVGVYDCCGEFIDDRYPTLAHAMRAAHRYNRDYPDKCVLIANLDNVDLGWSDGLTDEERERLEEVGL